MICISNERRREREITGLPVEIDYRSFRPAARSHFAKLFKKKNRSFKVGL